MPRDANGNYTLPAGNPVVSGQPISSSVQNSTMSDVASSLTDSLSRSGKGGMLAPLPFGDGSVANPAITFTSELTTGIYRPGAGQFGITILGVQVAYAAADGFYSQQPFKQWNGASYDTLLVPSANVAITGSWSFSNNLAVNRITQSGKGKYLYHDDAALAGSAVYISTSDPVPATGLDGDVWYKV
jgi:hypothetical protein